MKYQKILPTRQLQKYVRDFWVMEGHVSEQLPKTFKIIADGCPGMIFQENVTSFYGNYGKQLPQLFIHGLTTNHSEKIVKGNFHNISIHFKPTALRSIFGIDANGLTNQYIDINLLLNTDLKERVLNTRSVKERIEMLSSFLLKNITKNQRLENKKIHLALDLLEQGKQVISLREIQSKLIITERSLERMFRQNVGTSPKLFSRIIRFQKALNDIRSSDYSKLTDIAYNNYYADQSHYIRDFKEFAGVSPNQFKQQANEQVENFPEWSN
jgi:AraC-like DNA-binding protein